jgi:osmotically-inducible protein OsmY
VQRVRTALQGDSRTRDAAIDVVDEGGTVTLTGTVLSDGVQHAAEEIAQKQKGVIQVINQVQVEPDDEKGAILISAPPAHDVHGTFVGT